jgi:hypothetical protein
MIIERLAGSHSPEPTDTASDGGSPAMSPELIAIGGAVTEGMCSDDSCSTGVE